MELFVDVWISPIGKILLEDSTKMKFLVERYEDKVKRHLVFRFAAPGKDCTHDKQKLIPKPVLDCDNFCAIFDFLLYYLPWLSDSKCEVIGVVSTVYYLREENCPRSISKTHTVSLGQKRDDRDLENIATIDQNVLTHFWSSLFKPTWNTFRSLYLMQETKKTYRPILQKYTFIDEF